MSQFKVNFDDIKWESSQAGARFKAFRQNGKQIRLIEFTEDFMEEDWCVKSHVGFVLEGELEIDFGGERVNYAGGQGIFILEGENSAHKARAVTPVVKLILVEDL
ncbi:MAG: phosrestin [Acidobacteriota bacterium]|nr:phosrestin [Acidobacteriota bacterium]